MMTGRFVEYNWQDIQRLVYGNTGLHSNDEQKDRGEMFYCGKFNEPEHTLDTCIRVNVYDKNFNERIEEHAKS